MQSQTKSLGLASLAIGGMGSAFSLAACCALPVLLAGAGLSPYWLMPFAEVGVRFGTALTVIALFALGAAAWLAIRVPSSCQPGDLCLRPWFRAGILLVSATGAALLVLSKLYA